jgi:hypothetical protein
LNGHELVANAAEDEAVQVLVHRGSLRLFLFDSGHGPDAMRAEITPARDRCPGREHQERAIVIAMSEIVSTPG